MKNQIIFLASLFLLCQVGFSYTNYYYYNYDRGGYFPNYNIRRAINYPLKYPYYRNSYYLNSPQYNYIKASQIGGSRLKRQQRLRKINRKMNRYLSWNFNKNNNGTLTGYSSPISKNDVKNLLSSPTCNTDLWNNGSKNNSINSGNWLGKSKINDDRKTGAKTGVTIIYD